MMLYRRYYLHGTYIKREKDDVGASRVRAGAELMFSHTWPFGPSEGASGHVIISCFSTECTEILSRDQSVLVKREPMYKVK